VQSQQPPSQQQGQGRRFDPRRRPDDRRGRRDDPRQRRDQRPDERPRPPADPVDEPRVEERAALGGAAAAFGRPSSAVDAGWEIAEPSASAADDELGPIRIPDELQPPRDDDGDDVFIDLAESDQPRGALANVAGIKFREAGTLYEYDAGDAHYARGERVVVETERGPVVATVAVTARRTVVVDPLRRIVKRAGADEERARERLEKREREAYEACRERIRARKLPMKLIRAELPLQGSKVVFYFASEERVDFRDLVKDLSHRLHGRIEMRQVGARDEAKLVGGIGDCGRELCCSTFLPAFAPVSIKMAKDQGLVLNPSRVTGQCGRLKCCLVYEHALYQEMRKSLPKVGKRVSTPAGEGRVVELDVLRQQVRVGFLEGGTQTFPASTVAVVALAAATREPAPEPEGEPGE